MKFRNDAVANRLLLLQRYQGLVGLFLLFVVAFFVAPKESGPGNLFGSVFFSQGNLENVLSQLAVPGALAIGATFVILTGGIDLSSGALLGLLNVVAATWLSHNASPSVTCLYVLALSTFIGWVTGTIVGLTKLQPFVVTLAGMVSLRGIAYVYTNSANVSGLGKGFDVLDSSKFGIPVSGWILLVLAAVTAGVLKYTAFGRRIYAIGGNITAARYAGLRINRVRSGAYAVNGFCIGIAALLFTARNHNGQASAGVGYELDAITAAVVGGTSLMGGYGGVLGSLVGGLFIVCLNVLLILEGANYYVGQGWKGVIILMAVYLQNLGRNGGKDAT